MFLFFRILFQALMPKIQFIAVIPAIATGIGLLGGLFGGSDEEQMKTTIRKLSPEQRKLLQDLYMQLGRRDVFDTSGIVRTTRERFGHETSSRRIGTINRLNRAGVSPLQTESVLADITTGGLRELGSSIANIEFAGKQAEEARRMEIFRNITALLSGMETTTEQATKSGGSGGGYASLFQAGLGGLLRQPAGG